MPFRGVADAFDRIAVDSLHGTGYGNLREDKGVYGKMRTERHDDPFVLNLTEAARFIRVSEKTLRELARNKRIPCQKVGREWRFLRPGLEQWLSGPTGAPSTAESAGSYRQTVLFPDEARADEETTPSGFGDTAFTKNRREPLHRWVPWIAGFSAGFVEGALGTLVSGEPQNVTVLDPFAGVGTTLVEGLKCGYNVVGFEINPYAALACEVKLSCCRFNQEQLAGTIDRMEKLRRSSWSRTARPTSKPPSGFRSKVAFFSPAVERQVLLLQDFIAEQRGVLNRKILNLAFGSVMVGFSNYSYEPSLSTRSAAGKDEIENADVLKVFCDKLWEIWTDIGFLQRHMKRFEREPTAAIHRCSYLTSSDLLPELSIDVLITSPPYLNNYHYVRNTRPQLHWLGLVNGSGDLKRLEEENFGQFWQTVRSRPAIGLDFKLPRLSDVLQGIRERNREKGSYGGGGWANYAAAYFNDCNRFFSVTHPLMKRGGHVVIVVGNNIVQGINVETDQFLAQIGELHGFRLEAMHQVRRKRTGSSIVNSSVRVGAVKTRTELHETAIVLRAPC
ncbi:MAG: helix-turn-helix domain-containing protein [Candidatus Eisenbacteria bacterium]